MSISTRVLGALIVTSSLAFAAPTAAAHGSHATHGSHERFVSLIRAAFATAPYLRFENAGESGYGTLVADKDGITCIAQPGDGVMGEHYLNGALLDAEVEVTQPELLVYEPDASGRRRLVALEYLVFQADWDATHSDPPSLFGEEFMLTPEGNRYGLPPFYALHAWIWKFNPSGTFAMWNPRVSCP
jgi:hypothetical protein